MARKFATNPPERASLYKPYVLTCVCCTSSAFQLPSVGLSSFHRKLSCSEHMYHFNYQVLDFLVFIGNFRVLNVHTMATWGSLRLTPTTMHVTARALTILEGGYFLFNSICSTARKYTTHCWRLNQYTMVKHCITLYSINVRSQMTGLLMSDDGLKGFTESLEILDIALSITTLMC